MTDLALSGRASHERARQRSSVIGAAASALAAEVITGPQAYSDLRAEWSALAEQQPDVVCFQAPDLLAHWAQHFPGNPASLRTVVIRSAAGAPLMIWPLEVSRKGPLRIVGAAGAPVAQYDELFLDPACDRAAVAAKAMATVAQEIRPDILTFSNVRPGGFLRDALGPDAEQLCDGEGAPFADLGRGMEAVRAGLKTRVRQQQRKRMEKFEAAGAVEFRVAATAGEAEAWLGEILAIKRRWLVATGRVSRAFSDPRTARCLRDLARSLAPGFTSPRMVVSRLTLDGAMAAMEVGFVHRGTYHLYIGAFSEEHGRFGPGNVITEKVMEWCVENGVTRYDMMAPRTRNKGEWQSGEVEVADYVVPLTRAGRLYAELVMRRIAPALRERFYRLPDKWRSAVADRTLRI